MSGYYPSTFGFENDEVNTSPEGWVNDDKTYCDTTVIASLEGHNMVLQGHDGSSSGSPSISYYPTSQSYGIMEELRMLQNK